MNKLVRNLKKTNLFGKKIKALLVKPEILMLIFVTLSTTDIGKKASLDNVKISLLQ